MDIQGVKEDLVVHHSCMREFIRDLPVDGEEGARPTRDLSRILARASVGPLYATWSRP